MLLCKAGCGPPVAAHSACAWAMWCDNGWPGLGVAGWPRCMKCSGRRCPDCPCGCLLRALPSRAAATPWRGCADAARGTGAGRGAGCCKEGGSRRAGEAADAPSAGCCGAGAARCCTGAASRFMTCIHRLCGTILLEGAPALFAENCTVTIWRGTQRNSASTRMTQNTNECAYLCVIFFRCQVQHACCILVGQHVVRLRWRLSRHAHSWLLVLYFFR